MGVKVKIFFTCLTYFFSVNLTGLAAQPCKLLLSGRVLDHHENEALEYATVYIQELNTGVVCDSSGYFKFENLCATSYHVVVSHLGCETKTLFIKVEKNLVLDIYMEHHDELLEELEISSKESKHHLGLTRATLSKDILLDLSGKNLSDILSTIPGVSVLRSGPNLSKPIIHGLYGNRITILNHGIPQEGQQWGNDHAPEIDPNTADKISVIKGSSTIKYGLQALGGVVVIEPNALVHDPHWHGDIKIFGQSNGRGFGTNLMLKNSNNLGNLKFTSGFNRSGDKNTPSYILNNTGELEGSASLLVTNDITSNNPRKFYYSFYKTNLGILRGSHIGNVTDLKEAIGRSVPFFTNDTFFYKINAPRQEVTHHLVKLTQSHHINESITFGADLAFQANLRKEFDVRRGKRSDKPSLNLALFSLFSDFYLQHHKEETRQFTLGLQYRLSDNTNIPGTGISPLIPDYINQHLALYFIRKWPILSLPIEMGFRAEHRRYQLYNLINQDGSSKVQQQFFNFATNIGTAFKVGKNFQCNLDISVSERPPEVNELYSQGLHQGVSGIEEGDVNLGAERCLKIVQEWSGQISKNHNVSFSGFYQYIQDFIYLAPTNEIRLTIRGAFPLFLYKGADVSIVGWSIKSNISTAASLDIANSINGLYARNLTTNTGLIRMPPWNASSIWTYTKGKTSLFHELKSGIEFHYTAEQKNVSPAEDFLDPPHAYFISHIFIRAKWKKKNQKDVELILRFENIFNTQYRDYLNRLRYFADELGRNIYITFQNTF